MNEETEHTQKDEYGGAVGNKAIDDVPVAKAATIGDNVYSSNNDNEKITADTVAEKKEAGVIGDKQQPPSGCRTKRFWLIFCCTIVLLVIVVVIVLAAIATNRPGPPPPRPTIDYTTGVSLVTYYGVESKITSRLARTTVTVEVDNALDCSSIRSITLQLPLNTRVVSLQTISEECTTNGKVQKLAEARETFLESAAQGLPSAYIEEQDSSTHSLQVAMSPFGTTRVELVLEELLRQRLGRVEFQIPMAPNEDIDAIVFDLTVADIVSDGPTEFTLDLAPEVVGVNDSPNTNTTTNSTAIFNTATISNMTTSFRSHLHLDLPDARDYSLPRILHGTYQPSDIPDNGVLYSDGRCFEHYFHPSSMEPMARNIVFVLDTSESMNWNDKFIKAKTAMKDFIDTLTPRDTVTIQAFARSGTENLWRSGSMTESEKAEAREFLDVDLANARSYQTNLHEAFLQGLLRARRDAEESGDDTVTILMLISDGWPSWGETDRGKIAEDVYKLNRDGMVKIFSLGFQGSADMELLDAIAIMNGGVSAPILQGYNDFATQIQHFFESEFGTVLLSDVNVTLGGQEGGNLNVYGETQQTFPLLASGFEIVVRGLVDVLNGDGDDVLRAVTTAATTDGISSWDATAIKQDSANSLCFQSYAHARITQLLRLRDASNFVGSDVLAELVSLSQPCTLDDLADCIEEEAVSLAIEASVVAHGLTAMVTVDDESCHVLEEETEICRDGSRWGGGGYHFDDHDHAAHDYGMDEEAGGASYARPMSAASVSNARTDMGGGGNGGYSSSPAVHFPNWILSAFCICLAMKFYF